MTEAIFKAEKVMQPIRTTKQKRKAFIEAVAGHLIEWYDYGGPERRGLATSILMTMAVSGLILGSIVANGLASILGDAAMQEYGWRIPFIIAGPLGLIAAFIRSRLEDTAQFEAISESGHQEKRPIRATFQWKLNITLVTDSVATSSIPTVKPKK